MPPKPKALAPGDPMADLMRGSQPGTALEGARRLPLELIVLRPDQARQSYQPEMLAALAEDIRLRGVISPITVRPLDGGRFQVVAGEQRTRAATLAGLTASPAIIMDQGSEADYAAVTAQENLLRADLTVAEEATQYQALMAAWGVKHATELAARLPGRGVRHIQQVLQLATAPDVAARVDCGELTQTAALAQLRHPAPDVPVEERTQFVAPSGDSNTERMTRPQMDRYQDRPAEFRLRPMQKFVEWMHSTPPDSFPSAEQAEYRASLEEAAAIIARRLAQLDRIPRE